MACENLPSWTLPQLLLVDLEYRPRPKSQSIRGMCVILCRQLTHDNTGTVVVLMKLPDMSTMHFTAALSFRVLLFLSKIKPRFKVFIFSYLSLPYRYRLYGFDVAGR